MLFSSLTFLYYFLPVVLALYFLTPQRGKNLVLLLASLIFYWWGEPRYVVLMLGVIAFAYVSGLLIDRFRRTRAAKGLLALAVCGELAVLGYFKYADFFLNSINAVLKTQFPALSVALPIGISFYIFQTLSYLIDLYRGDVAVQHSPLKLATYIALFPQLIAGPIVRYSTVERELTARRTGAEDLSAGLGRFVLGLSKKVLIANQMGALVSALRGSGEETLLTFWLMALAFLFQIYFDFSGYSDMAIGLGRVFGFHFPENFNYPLTARSATEFWRRWHISMGTWFRDCVYIPLGGNRCGLAVQLRNIAVVWLLTGFWHGASWNYVLWGVYFGALLIAEKFFLLEKLKKAPLVGHVYTVFCILISWVLFSFEDMAKGAAYFKAMFGFGAGLCNSTALYELASYLPLLGICAVAATPLAARLYRKLNEKCASAVMTLADASGIACGMLLSTAYLISGSYNPFLYFRF